MIWLAIGIGGALGASLRALADHWGRGRSGFPFGILAANVVASFGLGVITGALTDPFWSAVLGIGLCGALSTFSTFAIDVVRAAEAGRYGQALSNVGVSLVAGIMAAWVGWQLALGWP